MRAINALKLSVGLLATLMLSIAMTASASAALLLFLASKNEKLLAEKVSTQAFTVNAGKFECSTVKILASTTALKSEEQLALVDYEKCIIFGFVSNEFTSWDLLFLVNGEADLLKLARLFTPANGCELSWPVQKLNKYDYKTNGNNLLIEPLVIGIKYTQNANCTGGAGTFSNGTYAGRLEMMIPNGTVSFDP